MNLANDLHLLADRLARLAPSHRNPFRFHEEKSELVRELHILAIEAVALTPANDNSAGFAPGGYMCKCNECGKRFTGAKHSWRCQQCEPQRIPERK
ncbi:hypothetical protein [Rhizobium rhizogenes]|uniref:hypothetical protein n=1 Tax=Rhizobium rhizogenes TaxID=359 RepID=UPI0022BF44B8|nr:hypothetical protein [Rhizobium rhizogenes]MCZ7484589.1 hypothetical protein [Rhizobium rhizogenes]